MTHVIAIFALVGVLAGPAAPGSAQRDLSGHWTLASATTNRTRDGATGERSTSTYLSEASAFNCGRECRIVSTSQTLTIENAQLRAKAATSSPTVTIALDGRPHAVVSSFNLGNTIETVGRWEAGKLLITSMIGGRPSTQTISLEQNELVVVNTFILSDTKLTLRYARKK